MKKVLALLIICITVIALAIALRNKTAHEQKEMHVITTTYKWIPTQIINNTFATTTTYYYTPGETVQAITVVYPHRAKTVIYTIYALDRNETITGSAVYNPYNNEAIAGGEYSSIIKIVAKVQTLTVDESNFVLSNESITIFDSMITVNFTNTYAILTLVNPEYGYTVITSTVFTADLRLFSPRINTKTVHLPCLPNIAGVKPVRILTDDKLILPAPRTVNVQIEIYYSSSTIMELVVLRNAVLYNGEYFTRKNTIASNSRTTLALTKLTENPVYNLPSQIACITYPNGVRECIIRNTTVYFNETAISYRYTFVTNGITLTETGWFIYIAPARPFTTVTIEHG